MPAPAKYQDIVVNGVFLQVLRVTFDQMLYVLSILRLEVFFLQIFFQDAKSKTVNQVHPVFHANFYKIIGDNDLFRGSTRLREPTHFSTRLINLLLPVIHLNFQR